MTWYKITNFTVSYRFSRVELTILSIAKIDSLYDHLSEFYDKHYNALNRRIDEMFDPVKIGNYYYAMSEILPKIDYPAFYELKNEIIGNLVTECAKNKADYKMPLTFYQMGYQHNLFWADE